MLHFYEAAWFCGMQNEGVSCGTEARAIERSTSAMLLHAFFVDAVMCETSGNASKEGSALLRCSLIPQLKKQRLGSH